MHLFMCCSLEMKMSEFRQNLMRQPELHQPPRSLLLVPRTAPQENWEERHDLEPATLRGGIPASACGRWYFLLENAFDASDRMQQSQKKNVGEMVIRSGRQESGPIAAPQVVC